jgi:uncharacterized RDD family membrane protein YckC
MTVQGQAPGVRPAKARKLPKPTGPAARLREFVTPEGVDLQLRIGDAGERAAAFLLDVMFILLILVGFTIATLMVAWALAHTGKVDVAQFIEVIWVLGFFLLINAYFVVFELGPRAATFGKRIMGLRVASRDGGRLTAEAVFARNAMREIEIFLPLQFIGASMGAVIDPIVGWLVLLGIGWSFGFALFPLFNRDRLRVGDFVAGTWVVKAPKERLSIDLLDAVEAGRAQFAFSAEQAAAYGIKELHVLEDVLRRRDRTTMAAVAKRIRGKIGWVAADTETDLSFLSAYYAALRGRLETRLLFGHRRKDKFDAA